MIRNKLESHRKARIALSSVRKKAAATGLDQLPESEIDKEIKAVRKRRRPSFFDRIRSFFLP